MNSLPVQFLQRVLQTVGSHQFFQTCEESTKCGHVAQSERLFDLNIYLLNANTVHYGQFAYNVEHKFYELRSQHRPFRDALRRTKRGAEIRKFEKMLRRNCFRISDFYNECFITDDALVRRSERAFVTVDALIVGIVPPLRSSQERFVSNKPRKSCVATIISWIKAIFVQILSYQH
ncbi:hypothetical protein L596_019314 [Steinernema carpocapsae]|uniref:Uncharacterized protein n=1 Tax=Steinernema carpocapsae TaxID=34508 RepID=A0A4U5MQ33_STECR|nr:hypothetical protein L596_019314 [Steinernema carpocapsae]